MSWKLPVQFRQRETGSIVFSDSRTIKPQTRKIQKAKHISEPLLRRPPVVKLKIKEAKKYQPCPRHGRKYLVREGGSIYCFADTKGEVFDRCFYHVSFKDDDCMNAEEIIM